MLANITKIGRVSLAQEALCNEIGAQATLNRAITALEKVTPLAAGQLDQALDSLIRADTELSEASRQAQSDTHWKPNQTGWLDDRLHELRQQAVNTMQYR